MTSLKKLWFCQQKCSSVSITTLFGRGMRWSTRHKLGDSQPIRTFSAIYPKKYSCQKKYAESFPVTYHHICKTNRGFHSSRQLFNNEAEEEDAERDSKKKPVPFLLSSWKPVIWPSVIKTIRNWTLTLLIKGYMDETFTTNGFLDGAEQAASHISNTMAQGNFEELRDLVDCQVVDEAKYYFSLLSASQRQLVAINKDDIFLRFIHEIGMIFDDETNRRFVEITTVFQGIPGYGEMKEKGVQPSELQEAIRVNTEKLYICNYRFVREFTKGVDDDWKINKLNHFHPREVANTTPPFSR